MQVNNIKMSPEEIIESLKKERDALKVKNAGLLAKCEFLEDELKIALSRIASLEIEHLSLRMNSSSIIDGESYETESDSESSQESEDSID